MKNATPFDLVATQLGKWDRRGYLKSRPVLELTPEGDGPVRTISIGTSGGGSCVFDRDSVAIFEGTTCTDRIPYADVIRVHWMSKDMNEKLRMKRSPQFDKLIVERAGAPDVAIEGLGQAVFPIFRALEWIAVSNRERT